ncbi:hypothetical protein RQP54_06050 [Curvibacter sp. APW13]|uniref:hypothetical protein n=1 Tax=Curvibacter sp. APW13 TaxID=3077236 RepID=UPI0028DDD1FC|nr:hypothetical protein [Curvibacter sp. APW13]MDT8990425.1 hypothetical protein [Curvibacter sp. APW13]
MLNSERLAIAAHLHVLLRRKTGRVTDTEWMAINTEYAAEVVRFARERAQSDGQPDLAEWATKLESAMAPAEPARPLRERLLHAAAQSLRDGAASAPPPEAARYIRGIR